MNLGSLHVKHDRSESHALVLIVPLMLVASGDRKPHRRSEGAVRNHMSPKKRLTQIPLQGYQHRLKAKNSAKMPRKK